MNREKLLSAVRLRENVSEVVASEIIYKNDRSGCWTETVGELLLHRAVRAYCRVILTLVKLFAYVIRDHTCCDRQYKCENIHYLSFFSIRERGLFFSMHSPLKIVGNCKNFPKSIDKCRKKVYN